MAISGTVELIPSATSGSLTNYTGTLFNDVVSGDQVDINTAIVDFGVATEISALGLAPRGLESGVDQGHRSSNWKLYYSDDNSTYTQITLAPQDVGQFQITYIPINMAGAQHRYYRLSQFGNNPSDTNLSLSELRYRGPYNAGVGARALPPTFSKTSGYYKTAPAVTLSSPTGGCTIYYTTDGSAPTTGSTVYTTPLTPTDGMVISAICAAGGVTTSDIACQTYRVGMMFDNSAGIHYFDDETNLNTLINQRLEAHAPRIRKFNGVYYRYGMWMRTSNAGTNTFYQPGPVCYTSTDLRTWTYAGCVLSTASVAPRFIERPDVIYNASTGLYVLWGHSVDSLAYNTNTAFIATSSSPLGPFTTVNASKTIDSQTNFKDCSLFQDDNGDAYVLYNRGLTANPIYISKLQSDYLDTLGSPKAVDNIVSTGQEAPSMFKRAGLYYLISSLGNFYDSTLTYGVTWQTVSTPLGTYSAQTALYASDPVGTSINGQCAGVVPLPGYVDAVGQAALAFLSDAWNKDAVYDSRHIVTPLIFTGTAPQAQAALTTWSPSDYFIPAPKAYTSSRLPILLAMDVL